MSAAIYAQRVVAFALQYHIPIAPPAVLRIRRQALLMVWQWKVQGVKAHSHLHHHHHHLHHHHHHHLHQQNSLLVLMIPAGRIRRGMDVQSMRNLLLLAKCHRLWLAIMVLARHAPLAKKHAALARLP